MIPKKPDLGLDLRVGTDFSEKVWLNKQVERDASAIPLYRGPVRSGAGRVLGNLPSACNAACMATM
jgi:hypothetical protein